MKVGGDLALVKGMIKALLAADAEDLAAGGAGLLDRTFIAEHTTGLDALRADIDAIAWDAICATCGLSRGAIEAMTRTYCTANRVIICYGMAIAQHRHGTETVQQLARAGP